MAYIFKDKDKNGKERPKWRFQYVDYTGRKRTRTGYTSRKETEMLANRLELEARDIKKGFREPPKAWHKHKERPINEVIAEYLEWGNTRGGRKSRPWSKSVAQDRSKHLSFWLDRLKWNTLSDTYGCLPKVERVLVDLQKNGRPYVDQHGKPKQTKPASERTLASYTESLKAFINWAVRLEYLSENPLRGMRAFEAEPEIPHRPLTLEEQAKLLAVAPPHRRLVYEVALITGLRKNELMSLEPSDLDTQNSRLRLRPEWTKNREGEMRPIPRALCDRLVAYAKTGEALRLYKRHYARKNRTTEYPSNPLLFVPTHLSQAVATDLERAGIPKVTTAGRLDFHALRTTFVNMAVATNADVKTLQATARHSTPSLTLDIYARAQEEAIRKVTEAIGEQVLFTEAPVNSPHAASTKLAQRDIPGAPNTVIYSVSGPVRGYSSPVATTRITRATPRICEVALFIGRKAN